MRANNVRPDRRRVLSNNYPQASYIPTMSEKRSKLDRATGICPERPFAEYLLQRTYPYSKFQSATPPGKMIRLWDYLAYVLTRRKAVAKRRYLCKITSHTTRRRRE